LCKGCQDVKRPWQPGIMDIDASYEEEENSWIILFMVIICCGRCIPNLKPMPFVQMLSQIGANIN
jgi:hypothetical protein